MVVIITVVSGIHVMAWKGDAAFPSCFIKTIPTAQAGLYHLRGFQEACDYWLTSFRFGTGVLCFRCNQRIVLSL